MANYEPGTTLLLQSVTAFEAALHHKAQQTRVPLAVPEQRTGKDTFELVANGGALDGVRFLSSDTIARMTDVQTQRTDLLLGFEPCWAMGFATNKIGVYGPNPRAFGHSGWGGSFGCADVQAKVGIGYVMNRMGADLVGDPRSKVLCDAVYRAL